MATKIEVGQIIASRLTGKTSLVLEVAGQEAHIVGIDRLERLNQTDPADGRWAPFVPSKEALHGWVPITRLLAETF